MRSLPRIVALYEEIDRGFGRDPQAALNDADQALAACIVQKRIVNDQAYWCFAGPT